MRSLFATLVVTVGGCAQLLGLDDTTFDGPPVDAPSVCDGAPSCVASAGRSICGQLVGTAELAAQPLRAEAPDGTGCAAGVPTASGPCAFTISALPMATFFGGQTDGRIAGTVDDCGRFVVPDLDPSVADVAVLVEGALGFHRTVTLVTARPAEAGVDAGVRALVVTSSTLATWSAQLALTEELTSGYLIRYTTTPDNPLAGIQVAADGGSPLMNPAGTVPWAAYFDASAPFGTLAPTLTMTELTGTALGVFGSGTFSLDGFRPGRRCRVMGLQEVANTLIHLDAVGC